MSMASKNQLIKQSTAIASAATVEPFVTVRASAGTGKTHALTTRMIQLLADGAAVEEVFAATFARKAAGEILARVLHRLAIAADLQSPDATRSLAAAIQRPTADCIFFRDLLVRVTQSLDRLAIGTLDSFFATCVNASRFELGLPATWTIGSAAELTAQRRSAIHQSIANEVTSVGSPLSHSPAATIADLMVRATGGATTTGLESLMDGIVGDLAGIHRETEPGAWDWLPVPRPPLPAAIEEAIAELQATVFTDKRFTGARDGNLDAFRQTRWNDFVSKGIAAKVIAGESSYYNKPIPPNAVTAYRTLLAVVQSVILGRIVAQTRAIRDILGRYAETIDQLVAAEGIVSFNDVTRLVGLAASDGTLDAARWRGILFPKHLLLDEFQDTSLGQWRVLERLAEHVVLNGGTFFAVGDEKQAIYGWRGGKAELIDSLVHFFAQTSTPLATRHLSESHRSSPAVLEAVNAVFTSLGTCLPLSDWSAVATGWANAFVPHAATTGKQNLPGWVRLRTAPAVGEDANASDSLLAEAALRAATISLANPGARIGVLVRTNRAAEQVIAKLKGPALNIVASAEGGNPLDDSPAVELLLSALTLVDHPSDSIARFHVGTSPLAASCGLSATTAAAAEATPEYLAAIDGLRRELVDSGYGPVLERLAAVIAPLGSQRDVRRLEQCVESARVWDLSGGVSRRGLLRTDDFVAGCRATSVDDPVPSPIRVMTIHRAKGLEFDIVVLTDLDRMLVPYQPRLVIERPSPLAPISRVLAAVAKEFRAFLPADWQTVSEEVSHPIVREAIATLYVGMTRAIQGLEIIIGPAKPTEKTIPKTLAGILRTTLSDSLAAPPNTILHMRGHFADAAVDALVKPHPKDDHGQAPRDHMAADGMAASRVATTPSLSLKPLTGGMRQRGMPLRTPSSAEGGRTVTAAAALDTGSREAKNVGTLLHAWVEQFDWSGRIPSDTELLTIARQHPLLAAQHASLLVTFRMMCSNPTVAALLAEPNQTLPAKFSASGAEAGPANSILKREHSFALKDKEGLLVGIIDRLIIWSRDSRPIAAEVIDFKFDNVGTGPDCLAADHRRILQEKTNFYSPQLTEYRRAVAQLLGLDLATVSADIVFMRSGTVVPVTSGV